MGRPLFDSDDMIEEAISPGQGDNVAYGAVANDEGHWDEESEDSEVRSILPVLTSLTMVRSLCSLRAFPLSVHTVLCPLHRSIINRRMTS